MCLLQFYLLRLCPSVRQWNCPSWNLFFDWFKGDYRQINNNKKKKNLKVTTSTKFCECLQKGYEEIKTDPHFTKRISEPTAETQPLMFSMYSLGEVIYPYCASVSSFLKCVCVGGGWVPASTQCPGHCINGHGTHPEIPELRRWKQVGQKVKVNLW